MVESPSSPPPGSPNAAAAAVRVRPGKPDPAGSGFNSPGVEREEGGERESLGSCTTHVSTHFGYRGPSFRKALLCSAVLSGEEFRGRVFLFCFNWGFLFISSGLYAKLCGINWVLFLREGLLASSSVQRRNEDLLNLICGRYVLSNVCFKHFFLSSMLLLMWCSLIGRRVHWMTKVRTITSHYLSCFPFRRKSTKKYLK